MVGSEPRYRHGDKLPSPPPEGYTKSYRRGVIFERLIELFRDQPELLTLPRYHYAVYNDNHWLWKIDPDKFLPFCRDASAAASPTMTDRVCFDLDDDDTVDESLHLGGAADAPTSSILNPGGRFAAGLAGYSAMVDAMGGININQSKEEQSKEDKELQAKLDGSETNAVCGWSHFLSDGGRLSSDGTKTFNELNMYKRIASSKDFDKHSLHLVPATEGGNKGTKLEDTSPALSQATIDDAEQLLLSVGGYVKRSNQGNTNIADISHAANHEARRLGMENAIENNKVKLDEHSDEPPKVELVREVFKLPDGLEASTDIWQGQNWNSAPAIDPRDKCRIKLTFKPILFVEIGPDGETYEGWRFYLFATIPLGVRTKTGASPQRPPITDDNRSDIQRQLRALRTKTNTGMRRP